MDCDDNLDNLNDLKNGQYYETIGKDVLKLGKYKLKFEKFFYHTIKNLGQMYSF